MEATLSHNPVLNTPPVNKIFQYLLPFKQIQQQLNRIESKIDKMAISQEQFDTDLKSLLDSVGQLIIAVDNALANVPQADLSAEDQQVQAAAASVLAELQKLQPPAPPSPAPPAQG